MDNPTGTVVEILHGAGARLVAVDVDSVPVCSRCAEGRGCGAGLLSGSSRSRRFEAAVDNGCQLAVGDRVRLKLSPGRLIGAAAYAYGVPLFGAVAAASAAHGMALGDVGSAAASFAGMIVGTLASRRYLRRRSCLSRFEPRVDKVL